MALRGPQASEVPRSLALELAEEFEAAIVAGRLRPGDVLPPVRKLAEERSLAPNTVASAYRSLARRGLVEGRGRRGTVVTGHSLPASAVVPPVRSDLVNLADGNPDLTLLPDLGHHLIELTRSGLAAQTGYGGPQVVDELRAALSSDFGADGVGFGADTSGRLAVVAGGLDGIERALAVNLRPGDGVAVEDPGYRPVRSVVAALGMQAIPVAVDPAGMQPGPLAEALRSGVKAVVATPRAQNPTGAALDRARSAELVAILDEHPEVLVIEDDHANAAAGAPYCGVVPAVSTVDGARVERRWATVRSMAKCYGPDLRLAALVGDSTTVGRVTARQAIGMGWVPRLLQHLVAALLNDAEAAKVPGRAAATYHSRRQIVVDELTRAGVGELVVPARSGFNLWIRLDQDLTEEAVVAAMERAGFAVAAGSQFRIEAGPGVRVSVAAHPDETLRAAGRALASCLTTTAAVRLG